MAFVSGGILAQSQQNLAGIKLRNLKQHVCDLKLLGFAVTSNPLSPDSRSVMAELQDRCGLVVAGFFGIRRPKLVLCLAPICVLML